MTGFVYAVADGRGAMKIGFSRNPLSRLNSIQPGCPSPAMLVGMAKGCVEDERRAHRDLRHARIKGEWFRSDDPYVCEFVSHLSPYVPRARVNRRQDIVTISGLAAAFLSDVEAFLATSGMPAARFGKAAIGDPNFVRNLRDGRSPSLRTAERVMSFIAECSTAPSEAAQ